VAMKAEEEAAEEEEMIDEEADGDDGEAVGSVFDGPTKRPTFSIKYKDKWYKITRATWTYVTYDGESGDWAKEWNMPLDEFKKRRPMYFQRWKAKKRKLRQKHGNGFKHPNGRYVYLTKMRRSPFTREVHGEKYATKPPWIFSPKEIESREQQLRARELKRRLMQEEEENRVKKLRALNVWLGDPSWRRPWQPKVDIIDPNSRRR